MGNQFKTMAEYKEIFGVTDGRRKNSILFRCYKDREWRRFLRENCDGVYLEGWRTINNMNGLKNYGFAVLQSEVETPNVNLMDYHFFSPEYRTDEMNGICEDGTPNIRYVNLELNRVFRKKSGKFLMSIIDSHKIGSHFPTQMKTYLCEEFSRDWIAYAMSKIGNLELSTEISFADIYGNGDFECNNMGSCMNGKYQDSFYEEFVDATPAALISKDKKQILARCVVFNKVTDESTGRVYRLAERQYSTDGDETLKKALVEMLISKGLIDGYKCVGAGCGDASSFVLNDGTSISDKLLSISCSINWGDTLSYQDSFKWLNMDERKAYNKAHRCDVTLDSTEPTLYDEDASYDDYHECYTHNYTVEVYYNGNYISCDENRLEDFVEINDEWVHKDDVVRCPYCEDDFKKGDLDCYSSLLDDYFCCDTCRCEAEEKYKAEHFTYSEFDDDYFEDEKDVTFILKWNWSRMAFEQTSIYIRTLVTLYLNWEMEKRDGIMYYVCGRKGPELTKFLNDVLAA